MAKTGKAENVGRRIGGAFPCNAEDYRVIQAALKNNPGFVPIHQQHWFAGFSSDMAQRGLRVDGQGFVVVEQPKTAVV